MVVLQYFGGLPLKQELVVIAILLAMASTTVVTSCTLVLSLLLLKTVANMTVLFLCTAVWLLYCHNAQHWLHPWCWCTCSDKYTMYNALYCTGVHACTRIVYWHTLLLVLTYLLCPMTRLLKRTRIVMCLLQTPS